VPPLLEFTVFSPLFRPNLFPSVLCKMEWLLVFLFTGALDPYGILNFADESTRKAEEEALADNLGYGWSFACIVYLE
jgi:hypothetical protein